MVLVDDIQPQNQNLTAQKFHEKQFKCKTISIIPVEM